MNCTNFLLLLYPHLKLYYGQIPLHFEMVEASLIHLMDNSQSVEYIEDGDKMYKNFGYPLYAVDEILLR